MIISYEKMENWLSYVPGVISNKEDLMSRTQPNYKAKDGNSTFECVMMLNDIIVDAGLSKGPK